MTSLASVPVIFRELVALSGVQRSQPLFNEGDKRVPFSVTDAPGSGDRFFLSNNFLLGAGRGETAPECDTCRSTCATHVSDTHLHFFLCRVVDLSFFSFKNDSSFVIRNRLHRTPALVRNSMKYFFGVVLDSYWTVSIRVPIIVSISHEPAAWPISTRPTNTRAVQQYYHII